MIRLIGLFLVLVSSIVVYGGTRDSLTPDSKYIEYGEKFEFVGKICGTYKDGSKFCGSSVAIDENCILTAAHVVDNADVCHVVFGDTTYKIIKIIIHKDFNKEFGIGDIALCHLEDKLTLDFFPSLYENQNEIGKVACISGYGLTGTFNTGAVKGDGNRRAGSNMVDRIEKKMLVCNPSPRNSKNFTSLEFCIASGDSGGGLFIDGKLAGINSCVTSMNSSPNSRYGEESCHTRISQFIEWIKINKK